MKRKVGFILGLVLLLVVCAAVFWGLDHAFDRCDFIRQMFNGPAARNAVMGQLTPDDPNTIANRELLMARISMFLFAGVTMMQIFALYVAAHVLGSLRKSAEPVKIRLKLLENADIFLDVPLYIGLFGTVSSFLVMTYSPTSSRLIAYSSTLIGIIFSLTLRLLLNYPLRRKWISELD
ncbi:MAG: hypothetical protein J6S73_03680, partial [Lentisphaeria bacterium]|nr:hypothetical protein [Lentisphaeria bacterium]